ncbi:MAG: DUF1553 domain-containing protein, partial [Planctomycetaceae bacterium]|nr:DUF1553 domain-containing protein [Planctomycetaceae bacterium]
LGIQGGNSGPAIVPGKAGESLLIAALRGTMKDVPRMPLDADPLTDAEIELFQKWIDAGAPHPADEFATESVVTSSHWSFQPLNVVSPPVVQDPARLQNAIDAFIASALEQEGLEPSPEADRVTLIRRLHLDLLGVLPEPADVEAFVADPSPAAYENLVDAVLASPRYGERWGRHWLDAARYADSNGFTIDGARSMWPYRDWVVSAINSDEPFDQFTINQLAGDLLPNPTTEQLVATGFHRNTLANEEGGTDDEQFRTENVVDRVGTTATVWLGLTLACAQCHDHKFDPLSQRDFYRFFAILNNTADNNDADGLEPKLMLPTPEQAAALQRLAPEIAAAEAQLKSVQEQRLAQQAQWEATLMSAGDPQWEVVHPEQAVSIGGATINIGGDGVMLVEGKIPDGDVYDVTFRSPLDGVTAVRLEVLPHASLPLTGPGLGANGNFVLGEAQLFVRPAEADTAQPLDQFRRTIDAAFADHSQENNPIAYAIDGDAKTGWSINVASGSMHVRRIATFVTPLPIDGGEAEWTLRLEQKVPQQTQYQIGCFRLWVTRASRDALLLTPELKSALMTATDARTAEQAQKLRDFYLNCDADWLAAKDRVHVLRQQETSLKSSITTTLVMRELPQPRESHVMIRGDFLRKGALVTPGVPAVLPHLPEGAGRATRLDLAKWLTSPENPLTARVLVNRTWQRFFGVGFVETENDFGTQGSLPSHPELLDWLAAEAIRLQWSNKQLHRLIVTSATYRQSSATREDLLARDPRNRLLARQSRVRLEAETIRDACLSAAGLLSDKMAGKPVSPPQPEGIYLFTQNNKGWTESTGEDRYRRGMYTLFWRSSPHPMMPTFDAPDANSTCTRRVRSNTPLQALTLANDRAFIEFAQGMALKALTEASESDDERLAFAFRCAVSRSPEPLELERLRELLAAERSAFARDADAAAAISPKSLPAGVDATEAAAWTGVARVLLNLDEVITRE